MLDALGHAFNRHDLVWLNIDAVKHAEYSGPAPMEPISALSLLHRWVLGNYPLIVARQADVPQGMLRVGLAEPASWGKRRLSFLVNPSDVLQHQTGPLLADVLAKLPLGWRFGANMLLVYLNELNMPAHVYGSTAIEALTGLPCITENSDLDVLFKPTSWESVSGLCARLKQLSQDHPTFKVDGEVLNPAGDAVHWLELCSENEQVLAKSNTEVRLMKLSEFKNAFEPQAGEVQ
ncbi:malonate decarboxylase holo-[acyl-carrier-protein] synthase [Limnobacter parvus]|uniref:Malonate decarboxylase holo-[acyl-carrier-protein] synthase n=1 Tax=Limnobacter parvus TaxID=2939690 RepID=A0ABT1XJK4_9BURK|nr:malonate decarboxylase holo-[acyl-carrier-protein] synthase [Limnobacter parvus]MCR2747471.1 malonate decarboxylase holo-[acyl-carrier-protein] synthase [Limnobacter parvus]